MWDFFHPFDFRKLRSRKLPDNANSLPVRTWSTTCTDVNDEVVKVGDRVEKYGQVMNFKAVVDSIYAVKRQSQNQQTHSYGQEFIWTNGHLSNKKLDPLREIGDTAADLVLSSYTLSPQVYL
jgi:hypothetical protein